MSVQYPNVKSVIARVVTDKPVRKTPYQVKGVFMRQYPDEAIIPFLDGSYRDKYLYPRVQVKILNEQIYIIGLHEGIDAILSLTEKFDVLDFGNITFEVKNNDFEKSANQFIPSERLIRYRFITPWVALNQMTGGRYRFLTNQEKPSFLNKLLGQNIIFIASEMGINLELKVFTKVKVSSLFPKPVDENNWGAFMGEFKTNFMLPNYIGIGNGITRGYGSIYGMFNPDTFTFDKSGLQKESENLLSEEINEDDSKIDAVETGDVPRPRRRKIASRQSSKQKRKKSSKKRSSHRISGRIFSEEFDIEEAKSENDQNISEDSEDSKFNTEKHHKQQHRL